MILSEQEETVFLSLCLDIGEELYCSGSEIGRIEDTVSRIGSAYGAKHTDVFAITSSIIVTLSFPDTHKVTQSRRISRSDSSDFRKIEQLNALSRRCAASPIPLDELKASVREIQKQKQSDKVLLVGSVVAVFGFTAFFGGNLKDALAGAFCAVLIYLLQKYLAPICSNRVFYLFSAALLTGMLTELLVTVFPFLNRDAIMIGDIMLLIPGVAITNSLRNILVGDTISGIEKLVQSLLYAAGVASGFAVAIIIFGG